jgi:protein gp37
MPTKIEWTEESWNFIFGCSHASQGCKNCYAEVMSNRLARMPHTRDRYAGTVNERGRFTGQINFDEKSLLKPLSIKKPTTFFISMSDLFHENVKDEWIDKAFAVMALCPQHTFQILTKRPERMRDYFNHSDRHNEIELAANKILPNEGHPSFGGKHLLPSLPLKNCWLGVSVENQKTADERIPLLLETPAAIRFLSIEPLLDGINLDKAWMNTGNIVFDFAVSYGLEMIDWVIVGGESGANARPMHPDWARSIRDQCQAAGVKFFFKQWGEFVSVSEVAGKGEHHYFPDGATVRRVGKKNAGRTLDGKIWDEFPNG